MRALWEEGDGGYKVFRSVRGIYWKMEERVAEIPPVLPGGGDGAGKSSADKRDWSQGKAFPFDTIYIKRYLEEGRRNDRRNGRQRIRG